MRMKSHTVKKQLTPRVLLSFFRSDFGIALILAVTWQIFFTLIGLLARPELGITGQMMQWDAGWYRHILEFGYSPEGSPAAPAFYPLFPLLIQVISTLTFGLIGLEGSALLLNTVGLWLGIAALIKIIAKFTTSRAKQLAGVAAFLLFPSAFFMHAFYSEAIFIAVAFWAYLAALNRKWWAVGVLLALLTASRLPSLLFIALCGLEFMRAYNWKIKEMFNKNLLWFLLAPLGFIAYGLYLLAVRGDFFAMFQAYSTTNDWVYQVFNPNILATMSSTIAKIAQSSPNYEIFINYALPFAAITLVIASASYILYVLKKDGIPLFIFGILSVILFTLNSNVVSVHRYALACVVIYVAMAIFANRSWWRLALIGVAGLASLAIQVFIYLRFMDGIFAG